MRLRKLSQRAGVVVALSVPASAWACPVCFSATDDNRLAFLATTVFLSLLPLSLIGGTCYWVYRQVMAAEAPRARIDAQASSGL
jgi:hypothetical protein